MLTKYLNLVQLLIYEIITIFLRSSIIILLSSSKLLILIGLFSIKITILNFFAGIYIVDQKKRDTHERPQNN
jgi:hypothetical protein